MPPTPYNDVLLLNLLPKEIIGVDFISSMISILLPTIIVFSVYCDDAMMSCVLKCIGRTMPFPNLNFTL